MLGKFEHITHHLCSRRTVAAAALMSLLLVAPGLAATHEHHDHSTTPPDAVASSKSSAGWLDFFTAGDHYMPRTHCMVNEAGQPDWPWIIVLLVLNGSVVVAYLKIFTLWRQCYLLEVPRDRNGKLMTLAYIFLWCAVCGYLLQMLMFVWPAYRLMAIALVILNVCAWRFAFRPAEFKQSFTALRLQRELAESLQTRNEELEAKVQKRTANLRDLARTDSLTGLLNRAAFREAVATALQARRTTPGQDVALLFLDLDRFKTINDSLGHDTGDRLLRHVGEQLRSLATSMAHPGCTLTPGRIGGDEFVLLIAGPRAAEHADLCAQHILQRFEQSLDLGTIRTQIQVSVGLAVAEADHGVDALLRQADLAMYEAKRRGGRQTARYADELGAAVAMRQAMEIELRTAVADGQLALLYQPIYDLASGRAVGIEALVRWRHPEKGVLPPDEFLQIAEDTGLILPIGEWVLRDALAAFESLRARGLMGENDRLHLNLSARQLERGNLPELVGEVLTTSSIRGRNLCMEISETTLNAASTPVLEDIEALRAMDVCIAMDDFGAGQGTLTQLHRLPIDVLKVDRAFFGDPHRIRDYSAVVHAVVTLAHSFGLKVVAEGVSDDPCMALLQALECDQAQGYLFGVPMPLDTLAESLALPSHHRRTA